MSAYRAPLAGEEERAPSAPAAGEEEDAAAVFDAQRPAAEALHGGQLAREILRRIADHGEPPRRLLRVETARERRGDIGGARRIARLEDAAHAVSAASELLARCAPDDEQFGVARAGRRGGRAYTAPHRRGFVFLEDGVRVDAAKSEGTDPGAPQRPAPDPWPRPPVQ
jgi:hypothetical protein